MQKFLKQIQLLSLAIIALSVWTFSNLPDGNLHVHFLNVGQGDSILIRTPTASNILIDGGPGSKVVDELSSTLPFYENTIDLLVLTHPDKDHIEGTIDVLERFKVRQVLLTGASQQSSFYNAFLSQVDSKNIPTIFANSSTDLDLGHKIYLDIVYPTETLLGKTPDQPNNASINLRLLYGQNSLLLTGDIEAETEQKILATSQDIRARHLKVAHHGSKTSSTPEFLQAVSAQFAYIQAAPDNRFGHPHSQILDRLQSHGIQRIYRNDIDGHIDLILFPDGTHEVKTTPTTTSS